MLLVTDACCLRHQLRRRQSLRIRPLRSTRYSLMVIAIQSLPLTSREIRPAIGVMPNFRNEKNTILVQLKGRVEHTGVVAGMMGSSVYIDGNWRERRWSWNFYQGADCGSYSRLRCAGGWWNFRSASGPLSRFRRRSCTTKPGLNGLLSEFAKGGTARRRGTTFDRNASGIFLTPDARQFRTNYQLDGNGF